MGSVDLQGGAAINDHSETGYLAKVVFLMSMSKKVQLTTGRLRVSPGRSSAHIKDKVYIHKAAFHIDVVAIPCVRCVRMYVPESDNDALSAAAGLVVQKKKWRLSLVLLVCSFDRGDTAAPASCHPGPGRRHVNCVFFPRHSQPAESLLAKCRYHLRKVNKFSPQE